MRFIKAATEATIATGAPDGEFFLVICQPRDMEHLVAADPRDTICPVIAFPNTFS